VTVVSRDPLAADAIATALFVLGPKAALEWARTREDVGVLVSAAEVGGEVSEGWNRAMEAWLDPSAIKWVGPR
jgi:thiamine biosynthesis lipoprotein ApbE